MKQLTRTLAAILCLATGAWAQDSYEITQEGLDALRESIVPELVKELGEPEHPITLRIATRNEVRAALVEENEILMGNQMEDQEQARAAAEQFSRTLAPSLLAKYAFGGREILVVAENFEPLSKLLGMPELLSEGVLRAVVTHEYVHAFDDQLLGLGATFMSMTDGDRVAALNAVMEGHAQHVARRISKRLGRNEGFERYTRAIGAPPKGEETAAEELGRRLQSAMLVAYYHEGERFIAALETAGGTESIAQAFASPPQDMATIFEPGWFLDPSSRPAARYDFTAAFRVVSKNLSEPDWANTELALTKAQLAVGLSLLPPEVADRATRSLRAARVLSCQPADPEEGQVVLALLEFPSPAEAGVYYRATREVLGAKDELMREGPVRITEAVYKDVEEGALSGCIARKTISVNGQTIRVITLAGVFESLSFELNLTAREQPDDELVEWCAAILKGAKPAVFAEQEGEGR